MLLIHKSIKNNTPTMKFIHIIILTLGILIFNVCLVYAGEKSERFPNICELSVPKNTFQKDSIAMLEGQKEMMEQLLERQERFEFKYFVLIGIVLFLVMLFGGFCFFSKRSEQQLKKILSLLEKSKNAKEKNKTNKLNIDPEIVTAILENLQTFEKELGFLNSKITLYNSAKKLKTNTKYLSKVINTYKLKSFRSYINDLRIQYSVERLQKNSNYRKYTLSAMAKEAGFRNTESFSKAFQKNTGLTVTNFLKQVPLE
jgi:AraC-like DNA-binding protein